MHPVGKVVLDGDFNSYTTENPMQVLVDAGYVDLGSHFDGGTTYLYDGVVGSLDHTLANQAALTVTTGETARQINAEESVAVEYRRYHNNATDFYAPTPFQSSDHDPGRVRIAVAGPPGQGSGPLDEVPSPGRRSGPG